MRSSLSLFLLAFCLTALGQTDKYDYPDTLWVSGYSETSNYGLSPQNPIKVGGGNFPKHVYRYLNSLIDSNDNHITYDRIGSCCNDILKRDKPLTTFNIRTSIKVIQVYFDQFEWSNPKIIDGFEWDEIRTGYQGQFENDTVFNGYGIYFFKDGGYYKGNWEHGLMQGQGTMFIPEQEEYHGQFEDGEYHGLGTIIYADGGKYIGSWVNGKRQGKGVLYYPENSNIKYIEGIFKNDKPKGEFIRVKSNGNRENYLFK